MSIRKRYGVWYCDIAPPNGGPRIRRSLGTTDERQAKELHDKIKHDLWREENLEEKPKRCWDDAALRWLDEMGHKATIDTDAAKIGRLKRLRGLMLEHLTRDVILHAVKPFGPSNSTKNRYLALIRAILRKARDEWGWLDTIPSVKLSPEPRRRIRWLTGEEAERLIDALPSYHAEVVRFALATGLRRANLLGLEWSQIDMTRRVAWVHPDQAKARRAIGVPLNQLAIDVLRRQVGKHLTSVFTYRCEPIKPISSGTWKKALEAAGIRDFRFHDLRHTWASWMIQSGVPLADLQELGGWETPAMVQKYAHLSPAHLAKHAEAIDRVFGSQGTNTARGGFDEAKQRGEKTA